jgi:MoaA/NifB/PqqE/SkfB family radical SAM enzyme
MCPQWGISGITEKTEKNLELEEIKDFIDDISHYKVSVVVLSGGEPFLNKEWFKIAEYIKSKKLRVCVITNGTLLKNFTEEILNAVDELLISLDGIGDVHNKIRGEKNCFEKIFEGIELLNRLKKERNLKKPYLNIACTISDMNYLNLEELVEFFKNEKIKIENFVFQHLMWTDEKNSNLVEKIFKEELNTSSKFWRNYLYSAKKIDIEKFKKEIEKLKNRKENIIFHPYLRNEEIELFYRDASYIPERYKKTCLAPYLEVTVLPDCSLWLCPGYKIGNIKEEKFNILFNNEHSQTLRRRIIHTGLFPICKSCCYLYSYT